MTSRRALAVEHLTLRFRPLNRALRAAVARRAARSERLARPDLTALCVTPDHVAALLDDVEQREISQGGGEDAEEREIGSREEEALRARAREMGCALPLDELAERLGLGPFEQDAILLCAAPEIDVSYERIY